MTRRLVILGACLAALASSTLFGADPATAGGGHAHSSDLEVHEWGTFTSMQGIDGMALEGLHHEEEALPRFVHNLGNTEARYDSVGKGGIIARRVTQKMETPVLYFYTDKKMRAQVSVRYPGGVISEWFPAAAHAVEYRRRGQPERLVDMTRVSSSNIAWDVDLIPASKPAPRGIPAVKADDPWAFARETRAAFVRARGTDEAEHYLFYRGLGAHKLPVHVTPKGRALVVKNGTGSIIPYAAVLEVGPRGARVAGANHVETSVTVDLSKRAWRPLAATVESLKSVLVNELVGTGLFRDEATAMVKTWSRQWFTTEGTRLIYIVPRQVTDALLPIQITPRPKRLVRTLVGRVEVITPAALAEIEQAVIDRTSSSGLRRRAAEKRLARLGRFLEPHLRHLVARGRGPARASARVLLAELLTPRPPVDSKVGG